MPVQPSQNLGQERMKFQLPISRSTISEAWMGWGEFEASTYWCAFCQKLSTTQRDTSGYISILMHIRSGHKEKEIHKTYNDHATWCLATSRHLSPAGKTAYILLNKSKTKSNYCEFHTENKHSIYQIELP